MTGNRACRAAPSEIRVWSGDHHGRPGEAAESPEVDSAESRPDHGHTAPSATRRSIRLRRSDETTSRICSSRQARSRGRTSRPARSMPRRPTAIRPWRSCCWREAPREVRGRARRAALHVAACGVGLIDVEARIEVAKLSWARQVNARESGSGFMPLRCATSWESPTRRWRTCSSRTARTRVAPNSSIVNSPAVRRQSTAAWTTGAADASRLRTPPPAAAGALRRWPSTG